MTPREQLDLWCKGVSVHNDERDICCPDFSCCLPEINTPIEYRIAFRRAFLFGYTAEVDKYLEMFLAHAFEPKQ